MIENPITKFVLAIGMMLFAYGMTLTFDIMSTLMGSPVYVFFVYLGAISVIFTAFTLMLKKSKEDTFLDPTLIFLRPFTIGLFIGGLDQYRNGNIPLMKLAFLIGAISLVMLLIFEFFNWHTKKHS